MGAASKGVDRLEAAGWSTRRPNPANRRSSLISLTGRGRRLLAEATDSFEAALAQYLGGPLDRRAVGDLATTMALLRSSLEEADVGVPTG